MHFFSIRFPNMFLFHVTFVSISESFSFAFHVFPCLWLKLTFSFLSVFFFFFMILSVSSNISLPVVSSNESWNIHNVVVIEHKVKEDREIKQNDKRGPAPDKLSFLPRFPSFSPETSIKGKMLNCFIFSLWRVVFVIGLKILEKKD